MLLKICLYFIPHYTHLTPLRKFRNWCGSLCHKLAWQGLPRLGNTFPLEHNALAFAITPADRNGANNPSGLTSVFGRKGFCTFFSPKRYTLSIVWLPHLLPYWASLVFTPDWGCGWSTITSQTDAQVSKELADSVSTPSLTHGQKQGSSRGCRRWGLS